MDQQSQSKPKDDRSPDHEIVKFCRNGQLRILSIWDIQRVHCSYVKENAFDIGSCPYYEVHLISGEMIKLSNPELREAYPEIPEHLRLDTARSVLNSLATFDRTLQEGRELNRAAWKYSDWIENRYQVCL